MNMITVSIIMPIYNGEKYISETLESVINQTYADWELLITDDGSTDKSAMIIEKYAQIDKRIKLFKQSNSGSAAARNNSLRQSKGKYISFLDSDDIWYPTFLEKQLTFLKEKSADLVYASYEMIDESGNRKNKPFIVPNEINYKGLLKTNPISCLTSIYNCEKIGKIYFKEELKSYRDDYIMWLEILKRIDKACGNTEILGKYRVFKSSTTGNKRKLLVPHFNAYYKVEKLGIIKSIYYTFHWAINGLKKYSSK